MREDSNSRHTGGVAIYLRNSIKSVTTYSYKSTNNKLWSMSVKLNNYIDDLVLTILYNSPSNSKAEFLEYFETFVNDKIDNGKINIICGDFNYDLLKNEFYSNKMKRLLKSLGLKQLVKEPTRIAAVNVELPDGSRETRISKTLIDFVICNFKYFDVNRMEDHKITDHQTLKLNYLKQSLVLKNEKK